MCIVHPSTVKQEIHYSFQQKSSAAYDSLLEKSKKQVKLDGLWVSKDGSETEKIFICFDNFVKKQSCEIPDIGGELQKIMMQSSQRRYQSESVQMALSNGHTKVFHSFPCLSFIQLPFTPASHYYHYYVRSNQSTDGQ